MADEARRQRKRAADLRLAEKRKAENRAWAGAQPDHAWLSQHSFALGFGGYNSPMMGGGMGCLFPIMPWVRGPLPGSAQPVGAQPPQPPQPP